MTKSVDGWIGTDEEHRTGRYMILENGTVILTYRRKPDDDDVVGIAIPAEYMPPLVQAWFQWRYNEGLDS